MIATAYTIGRWLLAHRKLVGYALTVLAVSLLAWRIAAWRTAYTELPTVRKALTVAEDARKADRELYAKHIADSQAQREALSADLEAIRARFEAMPVPAPKTLIRTVEVPIAPQQTTCPSVRISPDFRLRWNTAASP